MLTSIDVKFTFDSVRLGLFSSANILQIADVALRVVFLLFLPCFSYNFARFLLLKRVKCPPFFVFTTKTTQPRFQVFSVNGALTCKNAAFLTSFLVKHKILPNLVISNWLWRIMRLLLANQNRGYILNE